MKRKNGFTLVELLAVIVLIALLMAIAVPNALSLNGKVKGRAYETKIDLIEQAANNFGQSNLGYIRKGTSFTDSTKHYTCTFSFNGDEVSKVNYVLESAGFSETKKLATNQYWCSKVDVEKLVESNNLDWDEKGRCSDNCTESNKKYYDNAVLNPKSGYIINKCNVYIYYRNNRVYSYFDINTCNKQSNTPTEGQEYHPLAS